MRCSHVYGRRRIALVALEPELDTSTEEGRELVRQLKIVRRERAKLGGGRSGLGPDGRGEQAGRALDRDGVRLSRSPGCAIKASRSRASPTP